MFTGYGGFAVVNTTVVVVVVEKHIPVLFKIEFCFLNDNDYKNRIE